MSIIYLFIFRLIFAECAYGQGVYFATKAEYSSRNEYAAQTANMQRNMFLCRVLVGDYTTGDPSMRTPPEITPGSGKRFSSTADDDKKPTIFVTYSDVQAYPEYRIVFTDS
jgi:poly [ADP-ribose] polymerase 10/14/15